VLIRDDQGRVFYGERIPAGGSSELSPASPGAYSSLEQLLVTEHQAVGAYTPASTTPYRIASSYAYHGGYPASVSSFSGSLLEQNLARLRQLGNDQGINLPPRSYLAVMPHNPSVELGVTGTAPTPEFHVVLGRY